MRLLSLGELQRLVNVPEGRAKEAEGLARLEEAARRMGNRPLAAFASVRNCGFSDVADDRWAETHGETVAQLERGGPPETRSSNGVSLHPRLPKTRQPLGENGSEGQCLAEAAPAHTGVDGLFT